MKPTHFSRRVLASTFVFTAALLAACGGGDEAPLTPSASFVSRMATETPVPGSLPATALIAKRASVATITNNELFQWAQLQYPELFGSVAPNVIANLPYNGQMFDVREFRGGAYLGISQGLVFGLGPFTNGQLVDFGLVQNFAPQVCSRVSCSVFINPETLAIGSAVKAPWTLMMSAGISDRYSASPLGGIFTSDGSAAGTQLNELAGYNGGGFSPSKTGVRFKAAEDQSKAYFYNIDGWTSGNGSSTEYLKVGSVGVSDGTASGTKVLITKARNSYLPGNFATVVGNRLIMAGGEQDTTLGGKILVSDGTISGTILQTTDYGVHSDLVLSNEASRAVWFSATSGPYGTELIRFNYAANTTPLAVMVKDIAPGGLSSVGNSFNPVRGAVLPNGKLIFGADDSSTGYESWVSDGTATGTFILADLDSSSNFGSGSGPNYFTVFGSKVVFSVYRSIYGGELVITDGTRAGTNVLDINVGPDSSSPEIIGQANGLLYFVATATAPTTGVATKSIFSTNGTTFIRLTDISSSAILLGLSADKAYFKSSDVARGTELWVADLAASGGGGFRLVKDLLVGSGSALAEDNNSNPMLVGAKLIFNAYTSATRQALFVSDGTSVGTVQLSNSLPLQSKVVGNTLVFATADGVFGVNVASAVSNALQLLSTANTGVINGTPTFSPTSSSMQTDTDQIFFKTNNGDLYSTNGNISGTIKLAGSVENFKVVGENALFFVQKSATSNATLWYSDGTIAGTRFVEALPINFSYDMDNAVAIRTIGAIVP